MRTGVIAAAALIGLLAASGCGSPAPTSATDGSTPPGQVSASAHSADPLCERFSGIYASWASAWKRDVDLRLNAGVDLADAQARASRSIIEPFRRAVLAEVDRDGENAQDPVLIAAMSALSAAPDDQSGFERLAYVCGTVGPIPVAR